MLSLQSSFNTSISDCREVLRQYRTFISRSNSPFGEKLTYRESGSIAEGASTRREQVLQAQRLHRERTKIYIKELETEVLRLRRAESLATTRADGLEQQVNLLLHTLSANGIQPPSNWNANLPTIAPTIAPTIPLDNAPPPTMEPPFPTPGPSGSMPSDLQPLFGAEEEPSIQIMPYQGVVSMIPSLFYSIATGPPYGDGAAKFPFYDPQAEIDFVMTLERCCMAHLYHHNFHPPDGHIHLEDLFEPSSSTSGPKLAPELHSHPMEVTDPDYIDTGHILTASMPLWQKVRTNGPIAFNKEQSDATRQELDRLLHSSFQLGLRHEITPVQILQVLRERAARQFISVAGMRAFVEELRKILRCYGFGAVFDRQTVGQLITQYC